MCQSLRKQPSGLSRASRTPSDTALAAFLGLRPRAALAVVRLAGFNAGQKFRRINGDGLQLFTGKGCVHFFYLLFALTIEQFRRGTLTFEL